MNTIKDVTGAELKLNGCLGCEIINGNLKPFGDILFRNENFAVTQDYELPINGFIIISSIRHIEKFTELSEIEQFDLTKLINKILSENTGVSIDTIEKDTDRDNFMSAEEAKKYGLIDKIYAKRQ